MHVPKLIGHRGYPDHYPENSSIGTQAAIDAGARYIEIDIQLTSDLHPVLFHDRSLERLCRAQGSIHDFTLDQLSKFSVSEYDKFGYRFAKNPVTTLEEFVLLLKRNEQVTAFVELKRISLDRFGPATVVDRILRLIQPVASQCIIISYSIEALAVVRNRNWKQIGAVINRWRERNRNSIRRLKPQYLFCDIDGLPRWGKIKQPESRIVVFETVSPEQALKLASRGVEFVETFAIGEMLSALKDLKKLS
ncbi:MAG: hypothetical protein BMS9Abin33_0513 [Gammaproteobacteria bacterium]|nr:MAG: hypothetical protein BMS9Abin33_0513 [Gammaproteobacteria bacterium]